MRADELGDETHVRKVLAALYTQVRGGWDTGKYEPGLANIIDEMREDSKAAKQAAIDAKAVAVINRELQWTNRRWLIGTFLLGFISVVIEAAKAYASVHHF